MSLTIGFIILASIALIIWDRVATKREAKQTPASG
jgi:hypothetical protein